MSNPEDEQMQEPLWELEDARLVTEQLNEAADKHGYHLGIIGSVATEGLSDHDLNLVILPSPGDNCTTLSTVAFQYWLEGMGAKLDHEEFWGMHVFVYDWKFMNKPVKIVMYAFLGLE